MKLKITIAGPKVHDVGYRYFLMSMAMANRIMLFEAYNTKRGEEDEVQVFLEGTKEAVERFRLQAESQRPVRSEVSKILVEDYDGAVMKIGEYAQLCTSVQMNKAIPVLLEIRDDLKEMKGDVKEMKGDIKAVKANTDAIPLIKVNTDAIPQIHEEIKGLREDVQPGFAVQFRQVQADIRAIKERLGMP